MKKKMGRFHHVSKRVEKLKPKRKPKKKKPIEVATMRCDNCGIPMVRPTVILEYKLSGTIKRLCSGCSRSRDIPQPRMVMLTP